MRLFVAAESGVGELTEGDQPIVRVVAPDLQQARRIRARIRSGADDLAVILDIVVVIADDFRSAQQALGAASAETVLYVGTVDGLVGLIADIGSAGVADGVTLVAASPQQDLGVLGQDVLGRLALRGRPRAS